MSDNGREQLAPWRKRSGQMYLTDSEVLDLLDDGAPRTPADLAESRRRENVLRLQCRYLTDAGLLQTVAADTFEITGDGVDFLAGSLTLPCTDGYLHLDQVLEMSSHRLTNFESLDPTDVKIVNDEFFSNEENDYGWVREDRFRTERRIWNVKGWQLNRLMEEFPRTEPLAQQCAHWMRAIVGLHFFPDANYRTGMATLYGLLSGNDLRDQIDEWPGSTIDRAVLYSKLIRGLVTTVTFDTLWLRDELYRHWERYFRDLLYGYEERRSQPTNDHLRDVLKYTREKRRRGYP